MPGFSGLLSSPVRMPTHTARRRICVRVLALLGCWTLAPSAGCSKSEAHEPAVPTVTVFAAASTADVVRQLGDAYAQDRNVIVRVNAAASSTLAHQIAAGASFDVFLSANARWMDFAAEHGGVDPGTRRDYLGNELVIVVPGAPLTGEPVPDPLADPNAFEGRLALGDPEHVPAGIYAAEALRSLGAWNAVEPRAVFAMDARAAVRLVELGEVDAGIVYATDAALSDSVSVARTLPSDLHAPIAYPIALALEAGDEGQRFFEFLLGPVALQRFQSAGFRVLAPGAAGLPR